MNNTTRNMIDIEWAMIIVFSVLKLTGIITWSWWWLLAFLFLYPMMLIVVIVVVGLAVIAAMFVEELLRFLYKMFVGK
jgi:hypothetical protein